MTEPHANLELSAAAAVRRAQMLPELLGAVRGRRRRRQAMRAAAALAVLVTVVVWWNPFGAGADRSPPSPLALAAGWSTFRDDPSLPARYRVATVRKAEWFVDEDGMRELLAAAGRDTGSVRQGGAVRFSSAALDPWPQPPTPEEE